MSDVPIPVKLKARVIDALKASNGGADRPTQAFTELLTIAKMELITVKVVPTPEGSGETPSSIKAPARIATQ